MKASNSERVKASKLRKKPNLTASETSWLNRYQGKHPIRASNVTGNAPDTHTDTGVAAEVTPTGNATVNASNDNGYVAPPAVTLDTGYALPDLRDLDNPIPTPPSEPLSIPPIDRDPTAPCGVCPQCRSDIPAPCCPVSGAVIPRPLTSQAAQAMATTVLSTIGLSIAMVYQSIIDPPSAVEREGMALALSQLSERYDMQMIADMAPWLLLIQHGGGYTTKRISQGKKAKAARAKPKQLLPPGTPHDPTRPE